MPDDQDRLFTSEVASLVGISESDWRARVSRGYAPAPNGYVNRDGATRAWWSSGVVDEYLKARAERLDLRPDYVPGDGSGQT